MPGRFVRICSAFGLTSIAIAGVLMSCNDKSNPSSPQTPNIVGSWSGYYLWPIGYQRVADSSVLRLDIKADSTYSMVRTKFVTLSMPTMMDSSKEDGTWAIGANAAVLSPLQCKGFDFNTWIDTVAVCDPVRHISIALQNGIWPVTMADKTTDSTVNITYHISR